MNPLASVIAGCAPGEPDCAAGTIPTGIDIWFILLMLLLVVAFVGCVALLVRRKMASRPEPEPRGFPPSGRA